jgi:stage II sporulation protein D
VLARELYKGWSDDAYRAQAVAARSYALCEHAWWDGRRHYDVVAGQASQAWIGTTADTTSRRAVLDTAGQYLVFDGRVVPAYYSSCCGGAPASATDAIREGSWMDIAPLTVDGREDARPRGCCERAPTARWKVTLGTVELARRLDAWATREGRKDLGSISGVKSIITAEENAAGRPVSFRITDPRGRKVVWDAENLRYAVNASASGSKDSLRSGFVAPRVEGGKVVFEGRGHGHGAGMCQYGAEAMGKSGRGYRQILTRYYPGAKVEQGGSSSAANASASLSGGE